MSTLSSRAHTAFVVALSMQIPAAFAFADPIATDPTAQCIASHLEGQRLRKDKQLRAARGALVRCSDAGCPSVLVEECTQLLSDLDAALPSLIFVAQDDRGRDVADARVLVGEVVLLERLDGKAVDVDPGEHTFRFEREGAEPIERAVVVREGDKLRRVEVTFGAAGGPAPSTPGERQVTPAFWIVGGAGLAGLALFGGLGAAGLAGKADLDDRACAPACSSDDVDRVRGLFLGADISLGIGLAALAVAPILYFTSPLEEPARSTALFVGAAPVDDGGVMILGGAW